ncbi:MAG: glycosyltransferase [Verrucomicrobia bacterium]|nr:glycosyltransferase [Verrucomicrobiota bacterium]
MPTEVASATTVSWRDDYLKISIIVPAFNEEKLIERSLQSIRTAATSFSKAGWQHEIVVCDNNSSDRTGELARAQGARVVFEPTNQISRARNAGAAAANGQWLIFVDADSFPSAELFAEMAAHIQSGRCIGGGATVTLDESVHWAIGFIWVWNRVSRWQHWMAGSFVFCQARAFRELNGFSQELFVAEEIDFSKRLKELARSRGEQVIILHRHPIETSARKVHLYSWNEHMLFLLRSFCGLGKTFKDPKACAPWYDGRR